jgi:hypothetical protein
MRYEPLVWQKCGASITVYRLVVGVFVSPTVLDSQSQPKNINILFCSKHAETMFLFFGKKKSWPTLNLGLALQK